MIMYFRLYRSVAVVQMRWFNLVLDFVSSNYICEPINVASFFFNFRYFCVVPYASCVVRMLQNSIVLLAAKTCVPNASMAT